MARASQNTSKGTGRAATPSNRTASTKNDRRDDDVPEGFDTDATKTFGEGWVIKDEGVIVLGRLLRYTPKRGDASAFFQIKLSPQSKPVEIVNGEKEKVDAGPGDVVNLDHSSALDDLTAYATDGGVYDVWIKYGSKEDLKNKRSYWPATVRVKTLKPATREGKRIAKVSDTGSASDDGDDHVPF